MDIEYDFQKRLSADPDYMAWKFLEALNGQAKILAITTDTMQNWLRKEDYRKTELQIRINELEQLARSHNIDIPEPSKS